MVKAVIALIGAIILVTTVVFAADAMLKQYGLDLGSLFNILFASISADDSDAIEFSQVNSTMVGESIYNQLNSEKQQLEEVFEQAEDLVGVLNDDEELVSSMEGSLGDYYSVYLYSVVHNPIQFKVFEWTIVFEEGLITTFQSGRRVASPNVTIAAEHAIASDLLVQNYTQSDIIRWVEEQKIVVKPILEVGRVLQVLPTILGRLDLGI